MIENPLLTFLFVLANLVITAGYLYLALKIVPKIHVTLKRTIYGGIGFFLLCGLTHLSLAGMSLFDPDMSFGDMAGSWPMMILHVAQAGCVWSFVTGLYIEIGNWASTTRPTLNPDADNHHH
jgi:hypothetical protein